MAKTRQGLTSLQKDYLKMLAKVKARADLDNMLKKNKQPRANEEKCGTT